MCREACVLTALVMIGVSGNTSRYGSSVPTPFCKRIMAVVGVRRSASPCGTDEDASAL